MGRFLTPDPYRSSRRMENPTGWNQYAYVSGDPVNWFDPLGLDEIPAGSEIPRVRFEPGLSPPPGPASGGLPGVPGTGEDGPDESTPGKGDKETGTGPADHPRGVFSFWYEGTEYKVECGDGNVLGFSVNLNGNLPSQIQDRILVQPNTRVGVKIEGGRIHLQSDKRLTYDIPGPLNAHVSNVFFNMDGTYSASDIKVGGSLGLGFFNAWADRTMRSLMSTPNALALLPKTLEKISSSKICD
ncbi:MAG: hypothetical protein L0312_13245 [Acidobacteria bacterium]|nr:hypothetical protein [Acidobacteriota bacterium]